MWYLKENFDGSYEAVEYSTKIINDQIKKVITKSKKGTIVEAAKFMLTNCENITVEDIELALSVMDQNGDDHAGFGIFGSFVTSYTEDGALKGAA